MIAVADGSRGRSARMRIPHQGAAGGPLRCRISTRLMTAKGPKREAAAPAVMSAHASCGHKPARRWRHRSSPFRRCAMRHRTMCTSFVSRPSVWAGWRGRSAGGRRRRGRLLLRLLRARRDRPSRHAAERCDHFAAIHSMTSSARASTEGGNETPSAFAALRLRTSSILVTCSTGRSEGFAPLRIRPAYVPTRRYESEMLLP